MIGTRFGLVICLWYSPGKSIFCRHPFSNIFVSHVDVNSLFFVSQCDKDRKLVRYELDLGIRDAGEAAKKILEKRHVNYADYAKKQPRIDPDDGKTVTAYLNFQRNKLDHVPGAIETGLVGNSFEEQYSLIVETHEKIFRGYSGMLDQNRKEEAHHFISEEAILALTKGDF